MLSEIVKVVDGGGGGDLKCRRPEKCLVCRKNPPPPIVETRRKIVNVVGNCQSCRRGGVGDLKRRRLEKCENMGPAKTWDPRRHCAYLPIYVCV